MSFPDLSGLIQSTKNLVAVFDEQDRLRYANPAFRDALNVPEGTFPTWVELMRRGWETNTGTKITTCLDGDFDKWIASALSRRGRLPFRAIEADYHDGRWIWMTETVDERGWMLCIGVDITEATAEGRDLRSDRDIALRASQTDELTGISNRRYMMQRLDAMFDAEKHGCIALLDIDHFKAINDTYGHDVGDAVLVDFARMVSGSVRRGDDFGRIGGEEFLFLLPATTIDVATGILERIRSSLTNSKPLPNTPDFHYTISIGVTDIRTDDTAKSALKRADRACYKAKKQGRNRTARK